LITVLVIDWVSVKIRDKYIIKSQHGMEVQTK
jgi:phosphonate transport system permease protein